MSVQTNQSLSVDCAVFGFNGNLPQLMVKGGAAAFVTIKLSLNNFTEFPHHTFCWRGIDGSGILAHFPPELDYNSELRADRLVTALNRFPEVDVVPEFLSLELLSIRVTSAGPPNTAGAGPVTSFLHPGAERSSRTAAAAPRTFAVPANMCLMAVFISAILVMSGYLNQIQVLHPLYSSPRLPLL